MTDLAVWKTWEGRLVDGRFPLQQWLGGSDHSAVFLTELPDQKSRGAAVKLLPDDGVNADAWLARWRAAARLSHPNLVRLLEMGRGQFDGTPFLYIVMENAEEDLSQILPQRALTTEEAGAMLPSVLDGLAYLHEKGFVHGGIKPSNVMASNNQLKISSDTISSVGAPPAQHRRNLGDAPELNTAPLSPAADIWSVGVLIVATLIQHPPTGGVNAQQEVSVPETIPQPFRDIARACLRKNPAERCSIAGIKEMLAGPRKAPPAPASSTPVAGRTEPERYPSRSKSKFWIPIIILFVVIAIFAGSNLLTHHENTETKTPAAETAPPPAQTASQTAPAPQPKPAPPAPAKTSTKGEVLHQVIPDVPKSARNTITGTIKVTVRVEVDSSGKVTSTKLTTAGPSQYFARLAVNAADQWQFTPAKANGEAAPSAWSIRFHFRKGSTQAFPSLIKR